jgi:hypothetical protein
MFDLFVGVLGWIMGSQEQKTPAPTRKLKYAKFDYGVGPELLSNAEQWGFSRFLPLAPFVPVSTAVESRSAEVF